MKIFEHVSLRPYNSFSIDATARFFARFRSITELEEFVSSENKNPMLILGGGSNILFRGDYNGLVLKNEISGISKLDADDEYVYIKSGAGEIWHQFVEHCIQKNWAGLENLSLIPGSVGASPIQNIGAYGVEVKDIFHELEAFHLKEKKVVRFTKSDCAFGYRDSIFKTKYKNQFAIVSVTYQLKKKPVFNTSYGAIEQELEKMSVTELTIKAISDAVIRIRTSKLPNPSVIGNAGSFFKNPEVSGIRYQQLKKEFPRIVGYSLPSGNVKLAAGWLIEQCGPDNNGTSWKGYRRGDAGCHEQQALVLVNFGRATGKEIYELSEEILQTVKAKFGVELEREVNVL